MDGIIDNLTSAINTWNSKLAEIWLLLTESPETFKGGDNMENHCKKYIEGLQAIGSCPSCTFLCMGINTNLYKLAGYQTSRASLQTISKIYYCQRSCHVWNGTDDKDFEIVQG